MAPWIILAALGGLATNLNSFINRLILKDGEDILSFAWFYETARLFLFLLFIPFSPIPQLSIQQIMFLIAMGVVEFVSVIAWLRMFAFTELSISSIIFRTRLIWVPVLAFIFLGEKLGLNVYIGIIVLFLGLSIVVSPRKLIVDKGVKYSYLAAFLGAILIVSMKQVSTIAPTPILVVFMSLPSAVLLPFLMKNPKKRLPGGLKSQFSLKIAAVGTNALALFFFFWALRSGPASIINAINQSMMIIPVFLGITILKEKGDLTKKILGTIIALFGVLLLTVI